MCGEMLLPQSFCLTSTFAYSPKSSFFLQGTKPSLLSVVNNFLQCWLQPNKENSSLIFPNKRKTRCFFVCLLLLYLWSVFPSVVLCCKWGSLQHIRIFLHRQTDQQRKYLPSREKQNIDSNSKFGRKFSPSYFHHPLTRFRLGWCISHLTWSA